MKKFQLLCIKIVVYLSLSMYMSVRATEPAVKKYL